MLRRETCGDAVGRSQLRLSPRLAQLVSADGHPFYVFRPRGRVGCVALTLEFVTAPVGGTCGGFLCDLMGLGKTLQSLML
eukprot:265370-Chlamydomonas_euryale.AAC.1